MTNRAGAALVMAVGVGLAGCPEAEPTGPARPSIHEERAVEQAPNVEDLIVNVRFVFADRIFTGKLERSQASREFLALLPLDVTLRDYAGTEKVADLPVRLSTEGSPSGVDPVPGDMAYYSPWGNLAVFYRDFGFSPGLVRLGRIEGAVDYLASITGEARLRIERAP